MIRDAHRIRAAVAGLLAVAALGTPAGPLYSQEPAEARPGDRVRFVAAPDAPELVSGRLERLDDRRLRIVGNDPATGSQRLYELSLADVSRLEVLRTRRHTLLGLAVGTGIGLSTTVFYVSGFCSGGDSTCAASDVVRDGLLITVPGAVLGALIGSLVSSDEWAPVALP